MSTSASGTTSFKLRTPSHINSCHLVGSWDKYTKRYNMSKSGDGWWTLGLQFGTSVPAGRYWYYFILDGYFNSHDPNKPTILEPTNNQTLNVLDLPPLGQASPTLSHSSHSSRSRRSPRDISPSSSSSTSSSHSSRFPSPSSSTGTSPISATSKRSGTIFSSTGVPLTRPRDRSPLGQEYDPHTSSVPKIRTPSPRRAHGHPSALIAPKPRNPLGVHKLTLDTAYARPYSMITTAATTGGDDSDYSPISAGSSRSTSSAGSYCSSCSGSISTWSDSSSPTTPICTCRFTHGHRRGECEANFSSDESCGGSEDDFSDDEDVYRVHRAARADRRKTYHSPSRREADALAYQFERRVRI